MLFDWMEKKWPDILQPDLQPTLYADGVYYRWYPETDVVIGTLDDLLYFLDERGTLQDLGAAESWLPTYFRNADMLFDWLERQAAEILFPAPQQSVYSDGVYFRWYSGLEVGVGIFDNILYFLDEAGMLHNLGTVESRLP